MVILTNKYAIKIPRFTDGIDYFFLGIKHNWFEYRNQHVSNNLCPVYFCLLGLFSVQPRLRQLTEQEGMANKEWWFNWIHTKEGKEKYFLLNAVEPKEDSFGFDNAGNLLAFDYGHLEGYD